MEPQATPGVIFVGIIIALVALMGIVMVVYKVALWLESSRNMSSTQHVPDYGEKRRERRSDAVEHDREQPGTSGGNVFQGLVEQIETLDDDTLLDILAQARDDNGEYRFAESKIGRFVGGRLEDRIAQVRAARGEDPPAPAGRMLNVNNERRIPFEPRRRSV